MLGLVDYGSDSDGSNDAEEEDSVSTPLAKTHDADTLPDSFFDNLAEDVEEKSLEAANLLKLPAVRKEEEGREVSEDDIEEIAKPKDWEKKLADKARRKLEKKTAKRLAKEHRKEEKAKKKTENKEGEQFLQQEPKKKRAPIKIAAFGGLMKAALEKEDVEEEAAPLPSVASSSTSSISLFSMLPAPKSATRLAPAAKSSTILLPSSLRSKVAPSKAAEKHSVARPSVSTAKGGDSSDEEEDGMDFFGLNSAVTSSSLSSGSSFGIGSALNIMPSSGLSSEAGPARPNQSLSSSYGYDNPMEEEAEEAGSSSAPINMKSISNERAQEMIYKYDYAPWGVDRRAVSDADIIDVSVDRAIGPNVHENLLKNINHAAVARASLPSLPKSADIKDRNAKRKHQITYLANLAVAREEALQQKWAEGKAAKKMARQKYGF